MAEWDDFEAVAEPPTDWSEFEPVIKPTPYQEADIASMTAGRGKAPTGMEAGTEFTAATGGIPALAIPSAVANAALNKALLAGANIPSAISRFTAPLVGGEEIEPITEVPEVKLPRVPGRGALSGLANVGISGAEPFIQPASLLMLPIIGTGGGAGKLAATLFGAQQAAAIPPQIQQAIQVLDDPNSSRAQKIEAVGLPAISTALSALMLRAGIRPERAVAPVETPEAAAVAQAPLPELPKPPVVPAVPSIPRRELRPTIPETPPEPQRSMTVLEEIRVMNARTKEQIRTLFPQLSREQAAELRRQAWQEPTPEVAAIKPEDFEVVEPPKPAALTEAQKAEEQARLAAELGQETTPAPPTTSVETPQAATEPEVYQSIVGEMHQVWVKLPDKPAINVGSIEQNPALSDKANSVNAAERAWKSREAKAEDFSGYHGTPKKVRFTKGEYAGMTGTIEGVIQKRYSKSPDVFRIQIDGFPKPGGWSGKVTSEAGNLADFKSAETGKPAPGTIETPSGYALTPKSEAKPTPAPVAAATAEVQKVARTEGQRSAKEVTKDDLIEELIGKKPDNKVELISSRVAWENRKKQYAKLTKSELVSRVESARQDKQAAQLLHSTRQPIAAELQKLADDAGLRWRTALRGRAEREGVRFSPPQGAARGDAVFSLADSIARKRIKESPTPATGEGMESPPGPGAQTRGELPMAGPGSPWIGQGPDPYVMGLKTGSPVLNRIQARASNFFKAVKQLVQRRGQKADLSLITNRVDTLPAMEGEQAKRSITLRAPDPYDRKAISVLMQSLKESDPRDYLRQKKADMETAAQAFMQRGQAMDKLQATAAKELAAAYARAEANFDRLRPIAETARARFDRQHARDTAAGLNVAYEEWYVPQRWELDLVKSGNGAVVLADQGGGGGAAFKKAKVFPDFASAVEYSIAHPGEYFIPRSLDVADLLGHRVRASEKILTRQSLFDEFKTVKDPVDRKPIAMDVPRRAIPRPDGTVDYQESVPLGYERREIMPGKPIAIHKGYVRLLDAITGRSQLSESAPIQGLRNLAAVEKHIGLALDTFHASRVLQGGAALGHKVYTGKTLTKALALVEYEKRDLAEAVQRGEITQEMADYVSKPTEWKIGGRTVRASRSAIVRLLQNNGLNNMRISDAIYKDWIRDIPVIGGVNKWVFDKLTRGVISDIGQIEFDRVSRARPDLNGTQVAREVARNVNAFFGNIGKEGLLKNPSTRTLANIIFLAPNWVLSLATRELLAAKQAAKLPIDLLRGQPTHLGTAARGVGTGLAAYFIGTQILNLFTRGTLTIANPEEGHKLDAWIPDLTGKSDGFFISPMSVFGEVTHDFLKYYRTKNTAHDAALQIVHNKLGNLGRAAYVTATGRDPITDAKLPTTASRAFTAGIQLAPVPITASTPFRAAAQAIAPGTIQKPPPGAIQRQLTASMGFKTEPVPSANTQIRQLSKEWMAESTDPKLRHKLEQMQAYDYPSAFRDLRSALRNNDMEMAKAEYRRLLEYHKADAIANSFEHMKPFTGSLATESRFKASLDAEQRELYKRAVQERKDLNAKFRAMKKGQE